jgi:hypothetical protein
MGRDWHNPRHRDNEDYLKLEVDEHGAATICEYFIIE